MNLANKKLVVALSGGVDSIALLHYYKKYNIRAIHINHNLSNNAQKWSNFCENFCENFKINLQVLCVNIDGNNNIEEKARNLRYQALFANLQKDEILLTAHHQDDQVETVLLNLFRGSGSSGLSAMPAIKGKHYRPFLDKNKQWIVDYALQHNLDYVIDESNFDNNFRRNFLRNEVLPLINTKYKNINKTLARFVDNQQQNLKLNIDLAKIDISNNNLVIGNNLNIDNLKKLKQHRIINIIYYHLTTLKLKPISSKVMQQVINAIYSKNDTKTLIKIKQLEIRKFSNQLYFLTNLNNKDNDCILKDELKNINGFNIQFRKSGQRIKFTHKKHSQSLKKIIQAQKIPPWERDNLRLYYIFDELVAIEKIGFIKKS